MKERNCNILIIKDILSFEIENKGREKIDFEREKALNLTSGKVILAIYIIKRFEYTNEGNRNVERNLAYYNLDMIISVGYRVKSHSGVQLYKNVQSKYENFICLHHVMVFFLWLHL